MSAQGSLRWIAESEKTISYASQWTRPAQADGYILYSSPVEIDGVTQANLIFTGGTYINYPERHVTFELALWGHEEQRRIRLMRIDWKSLKGGHSNRRGKCIGEWDGVRVGASHLHSFDQNWIESEMRMKKGKLPCARPIEPDPQSFEELKLFTGKCFKINNINIVQAPEWEYDLFHGDF